MNFIISIGLISAGIYVLYAELFVSYSGIHGRYQPFTLGLIYSAAALFGCGFMFLAR
jgi:hypothetical protein